MVTQGIKSMTGHKTASHIPLSWGHSHRRHTEMSLWWPGLCEHWLTFYSFRPLHTFKAHGPQGTNEHLLYPDTDTCSENVNGCTINQIPCPSFQMQHKISSFFTGPFICPEIQYSGWSSWRIPRGGQSSKEQPHSYVPLTGTAISAKQQETPPVPAALQGARHRAAQQRQEVLLSTQQQEASPLPARPQDARASVC